MTYNQESNVHVVERVVFFPAEGLVCPRVEDGILCQHDLATENVVACPLHDTPRWWPTLRGLTRTPPLKMKSRNSEERFGFDDENPLMCIVLLSIESDTYPA